MALVVLVVFSVQLGWFPMGFSAPVGVAAADVTFADALHHMALPAITLSVTGVANIALHTREKAIDVMESDYVRFARTRGESTWGIVRRHGLRNLAMPGHNAAVRVDYCWRYSADRCLWSRCSRTRGSGRRP